MSLFYEHLRRHWAALTVVWITRIALAIVVVPTGLRKLLGIPFSRNLEPWAAFFFDALYAAGPYWRFLGFCEVAAGVLLLLPRLTFLGALMYAGIATNLLFITIGLHFLPDAIISTSLMLAASLGLIAWDWEKVKVLLSIGSGNPAHGQAHRSVREGVASAWSHPPLRIALAGVAFLWLAVSVLDAMESPALTAAVWLLAGLLISLILIAFAAAVKDSRARASVPPP